MIDDTRISAERRFYDEWTPAKIEQLTALWAAGRSGSEIGAIMGLTKSAVLGKVHRLELPPRKSPIIRSSARVASTTASPLPKPAKSAARKGPRPQGVPADLAPVPVEHKPLNGTGVLFGTAKKSQCAAPLWNDGTPKAERRVCGLPVEAGSAYCSHHRAAYYTKSHAYGQTIKMTDFSIKHLNPRSK